MVEHEYSLVQIAYSPSKRKVSKIKNQTVVNVKK